MKHLSAECYCMLSRHKSSQTLALAAQPCTCAGKLSTPELSPMMYRQKQIDS